MSEGQLDHLRSILSQWRTQLMEEVDRTVNHMQDDAANFLIPLTEQLKKKSSASSCAHVIGNASSSRRSIKPSTCSKPMTSAIAKPAVLRSVYAVWKLAQLPRNAWIVRHSTKSKSDKSTANGSPDALRSVCAFTNGPAPSRQPCDCPRQFLRHQTKRRPLVCADR